MQKYTVAQELDVITELIAAHPNGVNMGVLTQNLVTHNLILPRRTLQRRQEALPDAFRLKYRTALHQTVAVIVRGKLRGTDEEIIGLVREQVRESDWEAFVDAIQSDLNYLYEGNIARY